MMGQKDSRKFMISPLDTITVIYYEPFISSFQTSNIIFWDVLKTIRVYFLISEQTEFTLNKQIPKREQLISPQVPTHLPHFSQPNNKRTINQADKNRAEYLDGKN